MSQEQELAKKIFEAIQNSQPTFTKTSQSIIFTFKGQSVLIPLKTAEVTRDRTVSFR